MHLRLNVNVQKLETEKSRKGKSKAKKDFNSLKIDYKKLRLSIRTVGLGKMSKQWRQKIQEKKITVDRWERISKCSGPKRSPRKEFVKKPK